MSKDAPVPPPRKSRAPTANPEASKTSDSLPVTSTLSPPEPPKREVVTLEMFLKKHEKDLTELQRLQIALQIVQITEQVHSINRFNLNFQNFLVHQNGETIEISAPTKKQQKMKVMEKDLEGAWIPTSNFGSDIPPEFRLYPKEALFGIEQDVWRMGQVFEKSGLLNLSEKSLDLLKKMGSEKPNERPSLGDIIQVLEQRIKAVAPEQVVSSPELPIPPSVPIESSSSPEVSSDEDSVSVVPPEEKYDVEIQFSSAEPLLLNNYDVTFMSPIIQEDPKNAATGRVYLSHKGNYLYRDPENTEKIIEGKLMEDDPDVRIFSLQQQLEDPKFKQSVLNILISKQDQAELQAAAADFVEVPVPEKIVPVSKDYQPKKQTTPNLIVEDNDSGIEIPVFHTTEERYHKIEKKEESRPAPSDGEDNLEDSVEEENLEEESSEEENPGLIKERRVAVKRTALFNAFKDSHVSSSKLMSNEMEYFRSKLFADTIKPTAPDPTLEHQFALARRAEKQNPEEYNTIRATLENDEKYWDRAVYLMDYSASESEQSIFLRHHVLMDRLDRLRPIPEDINAEILLEKIKKFIIIAEKCIDNFEKHDVPLNEEQRQHFQSLKESLPDLKVARKELKAELSPKRNTPSFVNALTRFREAFSHLTRLLSSLSSTIRSLFSKEPDSPRRNPRAGG